MGSDDKGERGKWDKISEIVGPSKGAPARTKSKDLETLHQQPGVMHHAPEAPQGAIAQFKANKISKKAALKLVEIWYKGQIEAAEHAVMEVVRVRKAEASKTAERLLMDINEEHFQYLTTLGLRNEAARHKAMLELGEQTAQMLKEIEGRDWPPRLLQQTMHGVVERYERFFHRLMEDLGEK